MSSTPAARADQLEDLIGLDYAGILNHDGWSSYDRFTKAWHQQCLAHPLRRAEALLETATRGAVRFPRQVIELIQEALAVRDRFAAGKMTRTCLRDARWELTFRLGDLVAPIKANPANERFAKHLEHHLDDWFTFPGLPRSRGHQLSGRTGDTAGRGKPQGLGRKSHASGSSSARGAHISLGNMSGSVRPPRSTSSAKFCAASPYLSYSPSPLRPGSRA